MDKLLLDRFKSLPEADKQEMLQNLPRLKFKLALRAIEKNKTMTPEQKTAARLALKSRIKDDANV